MKLWIRQGRAVLADPRPDGPGGKIRVKNKETGKSTFVAPKTLEEHPDRYEAPGQKRPDKQKRKELARKELAKRQKERVKELDKHRRPLGPAERKRRIEELKKKRQEEQTQQQEKDEQIRIKKERHQTWKEIANDHPELTPEQQAERKKLFIEKGIDSGGQAARAIRWWLRHHGSDPDEGVKMDKSREPRKLDKKDVQEHWKYGPKPNKRGQCSGKLKAVKMGNLTICVDPEVYDV